MPDADPHIGQTIAHERMLEKFGGAVMGLSIRLGSPSSIALSL